MGLNQDVDQVFLVSLGFSWLWTSFYSEFATQNKLLQLKKKGPPWKRTNQEWNSEQIMYTLYTVIHMYISNQNNQKLVGQVQPQGPQIWASPGLLQALGIPGNYEIACCGLVNMAGIRSGLDVMGFNSERLVKNIVGFIKKIKSLNPTINHQMCFGILSTVKDWWSIVGFKRLKLVIGTQALKKSYDLWWFQPQDLVNTWNAHGKIMRYNYSYSQKVGCTPIWMDYESISIGIYMPIIFQEDSHRMGDRWWAPTQGLLVNCYIAMEAMAHL